MIPTCAVVCTVHDQNGNPDVGARVTAKLSIYEVYQGFVVPSVVSATTDASGVCTLDLWPNQLGSTESVYNITIFGSGSRPLRTTATVPNLTTIGLHEIAELPAYEGKTDAQAVMALAVAAAADALTSQENATESKLAAAASESAAAGSAEEASEYAGSAQSSASAAADSASASASSADTASSSAVSAGESLIGAQSYAGQAALHSSSAQDAAGTATTKASESAAHAAQAQSSANSASTSAANALVNANLAAANIGAVAYVSGATYAAGTVVYSALTGRSYRRLTTGSGTTDPSIDTTNYVATLLEIQTGLPTIRPSLLLDFVNSRSVDPRITFTRASAATRTNRLGLIEVVPPGVPRLDFDPVTLACRGLLVGEARTRLNTVSLAPTAAQSFVVTAVAHTISFYGTGSVALSGAHTATVVGTGAYPTRTTLTFTPTAGTLTLTPTGSVSDLQVEVGSFATSVIRGEGSAVTRAADVAVMTGANFSDWYNPSEGTWVVEANAVDSISGTTARMYLGVYSAGLSDFLAIEARSSTSTRVRSVVGGTTVIASVNYDALGVFTKVVGAYGSDGVTATAAGIAPATLTSATPSAAVLYLGGSFASTGAACINGHIRRIAYYPKRLSNAELQALSAQ